MSTAVWWIRRDLRLTDNQYNWKEAWLCMRRIRC